MSGGYLRSGSWCRRPRRTLGPRRTGRKRTDWLVVDFAAVVGVTWGNLGVVGRWLEMHGGRAAFADAEGQL